MHLKERLTKDLVIVGGVFLVITMVVSGLFLQLNSGLNSLIGEAEPTLDTINHMLFDLYEDNVLLFDYLSIKDYDTALSYDSRIEKSSVLCRQVENDFENLVVSGIILDEQIIREGMEASRLHNEVENIRKEIFLLHKKELATGQVLSSEKEILVEKHKELFGIAVNIFTGSIESINERNKVLRQKVLFGFKIYFIFMILAIILFFIVMVYKARKISDTIVEPIDEIIRKTEEFVEGDYDVRLKLSKEILEMSDLQKNINNIFRVIEGTVSGDLKDKRIVESTLLREKYIDMINFLKQNNLMKKRTTISDLRKGLNVTHPTILSRLKFMEEKGYIEIKKAGREKFINLTRKGEDF